jgi:hypothetical protein
MALVSRGVNGACFSWCLLDSKMPMLNYGILPCREGGLKAELSISILENLDLNAPMYGDQHHLILSNRFY